MKQLLLPSRAGENPLYTRLRDSPDPHATERREFFAWLWAQYEPFAPKGFPKKLQIEFHQRWWEMYLTVGLIRLGCTPKCSRLDYGPDIPLEIDGSRVYLDAIAPSVGIASDRVPQPVRNGVYDFPERECLLRLTQALTDKCAKFTQYITSNVVSSDSPCIVALSSCALNQFGTLLDVWHPAPLSILAGAGHPVVTIGGTRPPYSSPRCNLRRDSGSEVNSSLFNTPEFHIISGVLYSPTDLWSASGEPERSISLFLNPRAKNPLPSCFRNRFEFWSEIRTSQYEVIWEMSQPIVPNIECTQI